MTLSIAWLVSILTVAVLAWFAHRNAKQGWKRTRSESWFTEPPPDAPAEPAPAHLEELVRLNQVLAAHVAAEQVSSEPEKQPVESVKPL